MTREETLIGIEAGVNKISESISETSDQISALENDCRKTFVEENERIDRVTLKLESQSINWTEVDTAVRGHPARSIISMLEVNRSYLMFPEDRETLKIKILAYGKKLVELKIITQEYLNDAVSVHEAVIEKAKIERASKEEL